MEQLALNQNGSETCSFPLGPARLSRRQLQAIPHFILAKSIDEASKKSKISRNTFARWLKDPNFRAEVKKVREQVLAEAVGRLQISVDRAVDLLSELMEADQKSIRLRAAEKIVDFFFKIKETQDFEQRLERLESIVLERGSTI
jgi:negative regulator of replication initiation